MSNYIIPVANHTIAGATLSFWPCPQCYIVRELPRVSYQAHLPPGYSGSSSYERLRVASVLALVEVFDIPLSRIAINVALPGNNRRKAPIVVYRDSGQQQPLLVLECNRESINNRQRDESFGRAVHKARQLGAMWALCAVGTKRVLVARAADPSSVIELPFGLLKGVIN